MARCIGLFGVAAVTGWWTARGAEPHFQPPAGLRAELFAGHPQFANPVALSVGADGRVYVTETRRRKVNDLDIRANADWLPSGLSFRAVADREAFYRRVLAPEHSRQNRHRVADLNGDGLHDWRDLTVLSEAIHLFEDRSGDGRADFHAVFAEGFDSLVTDVAAGVLAHGADVYATVAPDLWRLRDRTGDGQADERERLASGFGVHIAYAGHHLQSPRIGLDGRLYWAVGDVASDYLPHEGALFRSERDGTHLEVFARGLRNVHQFVFNEYGDILTADNDSDHGDRERWLHIVEGGEYGWRNWWQYQIGAMWGATPDTYAAWNAEGIWHMWSPEQGAWHLPPSAHVADGPCGMAYYPGTGMGERFDGHFFLAHFTGNPRTSGLWTYTVEQQGAGYRLVKNERWFTGLVPTGIDFSPDGSALFVLDWAGGWDVNEEGRLWRLFDPATFGSAENHAVRELLRGGFNRYSPEELRGWLAHPNLNVRRESQFALVEHGLEAVALLEQTAAASHSRLARIHALWGLEQIHRRHGRGLERVSRFLEDRDSELRAQAAKVLGEGRLHAARPALVRRLEDESLRVQFFAAQSLGKLRDAAAVEPLFRLLERNGTNDLYLRHAAIHALERIGDVSALEAAQARESSAVRLGSLLALRRLERPEVSVFLSDSDPFIVTEAARAINDVPIHEGFPALAALAEAAPAHEPLARRVLNANFRLGGAGEAARLAAFARREENPVAMRAEALRLLADWAAPGPRDQVVGAWRPLDHRGRELADAQRAVAEHLNELLRGPDAVAARAARLAGEWDLQVAGEILAGWVQDTRRTAEARLAALESLASRDDPQLPGALFGVMDPSQDAALFGAALRIQATRDPGSAVRALEGALQGKRIPQAQAGLRALTGLRQGEWTGLLSRLLERLTRHQLEAALHLDVVEAARAAESSDVQQLLRQVERSLEPQHLGGYRLALEGGDALRGRAVFFEKAETECLRCHAVRDGRRTIGGEAGPSMVNLGRTKSREYLLESIVDPNASFAEGHEQVILRLLDGTVLAGRVLEESETVIELEWPDAAGEDGGGDPGSTGAVLVPKAEIAARNRGLSGMPEGFGESLTLFELRDLVEYLAHQ